MDDGKPTGPKAKWWSRPSAEGALPQGSGVPPARSDEVTAQLPPVADEPSAVVGPAPVPAGPAHALGDAAPAPAGPAPVPTDPAPAPADAVPTPHQGRPQPLHEPDAYSTPPYGGPGPWALAPPVQRPTPAHGTPMPPPAHQAPPQVQIPQQPHAQPHQSHHQPLPLPVPPPPSQGHAQAQAPGGPESSQWLRYDPWNAPGQQPLTQYGEPRKRRGRRAGLVAAGALALAACVLGGAVGAYIERNGGFTSVELPQADAEAGGRAPDSVAGIAASALPSVVTLHVSGSGEQGTGTGFVLDRQGHILTNNHVVQPASSSGEISVTFSGGQTARATLVGKDSGYDLAVVKVTGVSGLKPLPLGNSDSVQVGDPVVAIGAPFDLSNTVTSGIISAKQRPITAGGEKGDGSDISYVDALQTDAPINPGNSGGPLVDTRARVIGINSAIRAADSGTGLSGGQSGSIGLGFAIPINQGKRVAEELINTGKATHPVIGVSLDMEYAGDGARVGDKAADGGPAVTAGGPGAKAGIKPGDVITEVNGQRVHSGEELIVKIRAHRPGDRLELTLGRGGKERIMKLTLGSADGT
ncbi:trypsin-like peptidase domain-containing protein [Streptomyces scopuliridis]|uniref:S1C family serine protease n=1 Tax=Streptomyces scopuliridis TaxID=452529 RepID=UPI002DD9139F|nr:trypsin-like peptidase domain-containing protein [Streptomyces scopuliridis]WSB33593.1 trypsin-like peptidase domain-containing protein [Streptomyces scopuliridis]